MVPNYVFILLYVEFMRGAWNQGMVMVVAYRRNGAQEMKTQQTYYNHTYSILDSERILKVCVLHINCVHKDCKRFIFFNILFIYKALIK